MTKPASRLVCLVIVWAMLASAAHAERVHVRAASGDIGHAWLFGSEWAGQVACWLALPRHVVLSSDRTKVEPFTFVDTKGRAGQSEQPIWVGDVDGAVEAAGGADDLAFARVFAGPTQCLSRLGPPAYVYGSLLNSLDQLDVWSMSEGSYGQFKVSPIRIQTSGGGGLLRLKPEAAGQVYIAQGLSGAVATAMHAGAVVPFAMITEVDDLATEARAVRFDRVRAAFEKVQAFAKVNELAQQIETGGVPFEFGDLSAMNISGGPLSLGAAGECWTLAPLGGKRSVDLTLSVNVDVVLRGATLSVESCGIGGARYVVEQKARDASSWTPVSDCVTASEVEEAPTCLFDLRAPRQLRFKIIGDGEVSLADLRIY
ncbi:hypothetical protein [Devosia sp. CAU 1758]